MRIGFVDAAVHYWKEFHLSKAAVWLACGVEQVRVSQVLFHRRKCPNLRMHLPIRETITLKRTDVSLDKEAFTPRSSITMAQGICSI